MTPPAPPETMAHLPRGRGGMPVPHVAAWSSERWAAIRHDPLVERVAVFTDGRQGRGRPVFGAMNEPRQRRAVLSHRCGVCDSELDGLGWLPAHDTIYGGKAQIGDDQLDVTTEPPVCEPCARWSAAGCPAIGGHSTGVTRLITVMPLLQLVDPSKGPARHAPRFDGGDNPTERERLGRIARRHQGAVAYVKLAIAAAETLPL